MNPVCIVTDSTAQYVKTTYPGCELVQTISLPVQVNLPGNPGEKDLRTGLLPPSARNGLQPRLLSPGIGAFRRLFTSLGEKYREIIVLLLSSHLNPAFADAQAAAIQVQGRTTIQVIDSQTTSTGLGVLVQVAAEAAAVGARTADIEHQIRRLIPHIYGVFCIPGLTYLYQSGFVDHAQAMVGEMLGMLPIFSLEEGSLTSIEKVRNVRQLTDFFTEFLDEFSELYHISLIQGAQGQTNEGRTLQNHASINFPDTPFVEIPLNLPLAVLLGPRTQGIIVMEQPE